MPMQPAPRMTQQRVNPYFLYGPLCDDMT